MALYRLRTSEYVHLSCQHLLYLRGCVSLGAGPCAAQPRDAGLRAQALAVRPLSAVGLQGEEPAKPRGREHLRGKAT